MDIIVRGNSQEIDFVQRICRDKVRRGMIAILPATAAALDDVVKLKNERDETLRQLAERDARINELEQQLEALSSIEPESVATENQPEPEPMDDKQVVDDDDLQEVNLDADVKDVDDTDTKTAPEVTPKAAAKSSRCSKKSE